MKNKQGQGLFTQMQSKGMKFYTGTAGMKMFDQVLRDLYKDKTLSDLFYEIGGKPEPKQDRKKWTKI